MTLGNTLAYYDLTTITVVNVLEHKALFESLWYNPELTLMFIEEKDISFK